MKKQEEQQLRELFTNSFKDTFRNGLLQGSKAMCKVILDKANDTAKTSDERIADIVKFCEVSLGEKK